MPLETKVYRKENNLSPRKLLKEILKDIYSSRFLARKLAERDIKAQYRQSFLGIIWAFVTPLATAAVWVFINFSSAIEITPTGLPYPVFAFTGTLLWSIVTESVNSPTQSTNSAKGIIKKINFPKESLILAGLYKLLFNSLIKIILLFVLVLIFGIGFHWGLLWLPLVILGTLLFGTTIGLILTPIAILYQDVGKIMNIGFGFLMYITPVVYAVPEKGIMKTIMEINPFTPIILTGRDIITGVVPEYLNYYLILLSICLPLFFFSLLFYRVSIPVLVERS